ncbi:hypothetical protein QJQ45_028503 [Haematococcus lacustris]|nr:hypothetical protein QJQ45_028503 [Haematococcus lacustris]
MLLLICLSVRTTPPPKGTSWATAGHQLLTTIRKGCTLRTITTLLLILCALLPTLHACPPNELPAVPALPDAYCSVTIEHTLPGGRQHLPPDVRFTKHAKGMLFGNHPGMTTAEHAALQALVEDHDSAFSYSLSDLPGYHGPRPPFSIPLTSDQPVRTPPRRYSPLERQVCIDKTAELQAAGIVSPVEGPCSYAAALVLPAKKDAHGNWTEKRFAIDYRQLNAATKPDIYGLPRPDEMFSELGDSCYFSKLDMRSGFFQLIIAPADRIKTAFWCGNKLYHFNRMPFGLRNAPAEYQRVMDRCIADAGLTHCCKAYIDDLLIHSTSAEQHLADVAAALRMLQANGLKAHPDKSLFGADVVEYLGHNVSSHGLSPTEAKVAAVTALPTPTCLHDLRQIMGFINYYRCYVPDFSAIAAPITRLTSKGVSWVWGEEQQQAFATLKAAICTPGLVLRRADPDRPFTLHTDWSTAGCGAVLGQTDDAGREYMVACISRSNNKHERNYSSYQAFRTTPSPSSTALATSTRMRNLNRHPAPVGSLASPTCLEAAVVAAAEEGSDIHTDAAALHYLRNTAHLPGLTATEMRRVVRRAKAYRYEADQLLRVMADGSAKVVPAPATRDQLVLNMHGSNGHFGVRRTTAMLLHNHWWAGIHADVARILKACHVCDRARASFNLRAAQLSPLPVQGLFYRWGVDLAGPLPRTHRGNEYLMVCIEHLTKHVELVPIPDKLATTTAYNFHHQVLGRFGASAEVLTDGGREFQGEFADLLQRHLIDHRVTSPHHPQADGLAERAVQTFKDALRKHIAVSGDPAAWDEALPAIALGYRVSPQEATKCSPYSLLYGRAPVLPPAVVQRMARPVNLDDPVVAAHDLLERSAVLSRETAAAMGNIRIAQHRDTLRYATTHSGSYKPAARQLHPGSFVWTQRPQANTLQLGARPEIYRVVSVGANGVARLMGKCGRVMAENVCNLAPCHLPDIDPTIDHTLARPTADFPCSICKSPTDADRMLLCDGCGCGYHMFCLTPKLTFVPEGTWLCADRGTTALEVQRRTQAVATQPAATPLHEVFTTKPGRDRAAAAQRLHGRVVRHTGTGLWGVLRFRGQQFHPRFFAVDWVDGTITDAMSPTILRNRQWLQPEGTTLPAAPPHGVQPSRRRSTRLGPSGDNAVLATMATVSTGLISMASLWA